MIRPNLRTNIPFNTHLVTKKKLFKFVLITLFHWSSVIHINSASLLIPALLIKGNDALEQARRLTRFTAPFNLTGLPALSIPCGFTLAGLPIGLQIVSEAWGEAKVLQAGHAFEQVTDWHKKKPMISQQ